MKKKTGYIIFLSLLQYACENQQPEDTYEYKSPQKTEAKAYIVPKEKMASPEVVAVTGIRSVPAGKPEIRDLKTNVFPAIPESVIPAGVPVNFMPGEDGLKLPKVVKAIDSSYALGIPETIIVKEPSIKENNSESFISYNTSHRLKSNIVSSLFQDKAGNLWIGAWEGNGVTKFDGRHFVNYSTKQGLSDDNVNCIYEDKKGNIWLGTQTQGINKVDGKYITRYSTSEGMGGNFVWAIMQDKNDNMWFSSDNGLTKYNGYSFTHYSREQGFPGKVARGLLQDSKGNLWFGFKGGVVKFDGRSFQNYTGALGMPANVGEVISIIEDKKGNIWFATNNVGLFKYDGQNIFHFTVKSGLSSDNLAKIIEDRNGNIWISTWGDFTNRFDGKSFTHFGSDQGMDADFSNTVFEDRTGNIWLGTGRGVFKYEGSLFSHILPEQDLNKNIISCINADSKGNIWIGTHLGKGLYKYDGKFISCFTPANGLNTTSVYCIFEDKAGNIWLGGEGGAYKYDGNSFTCYAQNHNSIDNAVYDILEDKAGNLWFATSRSGVSKFDGSSFTWYSTEQGLSNNTVATIFEDHAGNIWIGTVAKGVCMFDGNNFIHYGTAEGLKGNTVYCITEDKHNNIWIGTNEGVNRFDGRYFNFYSTEEGLPGTVVKDMLEDKNGSIWLASFNGLSRLDFNKDDLEKRTLLVKRYTNENGFLGKGTYEHSLAEDKNGNIWIGAIDRLTQHHAEGDITDTVAPTIALTGIALFDQSINWPALEKKKDSTIILSTGTQIRNFNFSSLSRWYNQPQKLELSYNNNYINFHFTGITTNMPKEVRYRYFLHGLDKKWSSVSDKPEASYSNLPHGSYTFKVKAVNSDGYWSEELSYSFLIVPPWWQTWWFRALVIISLVISVYTIIRWRLQQKFRAQLQFSETEREMADIKQKASELEMQVLRAQMNPHFIFNSLNSINRFILRNNRAQASEYLTKFSRLVRMILQNSQASLISLESELEALQLYLEMEALRFNYHFDYKVSVLKELDTEMLKVPPLIIQPYVENAIWHGLMHKEEKGRLDIEVVEENNHLCIKIMDDGIGRKQAAALNSKSATRHKSVGLKITADRIAMLQEVNKTQPPVTINDLVNADGTVAGTEVIIIIPVIYD